MMSAEQVAVGAEPVDAKRNQSPSPPAPRRRRGWLRWLFLLIVLGGGAGGVYLMASGKQSSRDLHEASSAADSPERASSKPQLEVVHPQRGGMEHVTVQPATIDAFEFAPLYAKVSGYLVELNVDRGSRVKKGEVLAKIDVPERDVAVVQAKAALDRSKTTVTQAQAMVQLAEAGVKTAMAREHQARADLQFANAKRDYRYKQLNRITDLAHREAVEQRLVDEQIDDYESARAAVETAQAAIEAAQGAILEARARLDKANADLAAAKAAVEVSEAELNMAQVLQKYTRITSPYDGVVIQRGEAVHLGAFITAATRHDEEPFLTVADDHRMRTIIQVPDADVPFCHEGLPAVVTLDALAGRAFQGVVNRTSESEDIRDRTMRAEVDLTNPGHFLRHGMYGRARIFLEKDTPNLTLPSSCLIDKDEHGKGAVQVVRDSQVYRQQVRVGRDDGKRNEILSGLDLESQVVLQPDTTLPEGTKVRALLTKPDSIEKGSEPPPVANVSESGHHGPGPNESTRRD
jgi:RND family efflux transporter MFP subunit